MSSATEYIPLIVEGEGDEPERNSARPATPIILTSGDKMEIQYWPDGTPKAALLWGRAPL